MNQPGRHRKRTFRRMSSLSDPAPRDLPAAIVAADAGASVLVVETNYDVGGHAIISGGNVPLGGGTSAQRKYGIKDSPDTVFADLTDWSVVQVNGFPDYRYSDRGGDPRLRRPLCGNV